MEEHGHEQKCSRAQRSLSIIGVSGEAQVAGHRLVHRDENGKFLVVEHDDGAPQGLWWVPLENEAHVSRIGEEGMVLLQVPAIKSFVEGELTFQAQAETAWKLAKAMRTAGMVKLVVFEFNRTMVGISFETQKKCEGDRGNGDGEGPQMKKAERVNRTGWGGGGRIKTRDRFSVFMTWLVERFGPEYLRSGSGVLDVAGGKGDLAFRLVNFARIPTTIVDPRPLDVIKMLRLLTRKQILRLVEQQPNEKVIKIPMPNHVRCFFWFPLHLEGVGNQADYAGEELHDSLVERQRLHSLLQTCSAIVGMHADQATEAIIDWGISIKKPYATVPCCVFPNFFPHRSHIRKYEEFVKYLISTKSSENQRVIQEKLPFAGRNDVLFSDINRSETESRSQLSVTTSKDGIVIPSWSALANHLANSGEDHGDVYHSLEADLAQTPLQVETPKESTVPVDVETQNHEGEKIEKRSFDVVCTKLCENHLIKSCNTNPHWALPSLVWWMNILFLGHFVATGHRWLALILLFGILTYFGLNQGLSIDLQLEYAIVRFENLIWEAIRTIRHCELSKRGFQIDVAFSPPITRIERNDVLRRGTRNDLECIPLRKAVVNALSKTMQFYDTRCCSGEEISGDVSPPLLDELNGMVKKYVALRQRFFTTDSCFHTADKLMMYQGILKLTNLLESILVLRNEKFDNFVREKSNKAEPLPRQAAVDDAVGRVATHLRHLQAKVFSIQQKSQVHQENDIDLIRELQGQVDAFSREVNTELTWIASFMQKQKFHSLEVDEADLDPSNSSLILDDENDSAHTNPVQTGESNSTGFTEVFQGIVSEAERKTRKPSLKSSKEMNGEIEEEDIASMSQQVFGELLKVLDTTKERLAPVKVVRGEEHQPLFDSDLSSDNRDKVSSKTPEIPVSEQKIQSPSIPWVGQTMIMGELAQAMRQGLPIHRLREEEEFYIVSDEEFEEESSDSNT